MKKKGLARSMTGSRVDHKPYVDLRTICTSHFLAKIFFKRTILKLYTHI